ncbi:RCC1 domain-containing protein [Nannocystis radixulma]|uniref:Regulator of chromosome condensation (RCC1) repeat-containing protein n=1 Tax=Nannocystis radixulma TaxID=2995305 RepID=A0ABT5AXN4_9BACT|nr:hypothetical protein [Nannocystis radixulma]MDC0666601.1 hypothetical protein [Nannocystis radixulma]
MPIDAASDLDVGIAHSCVRLTANGQIKCWGNNSAGELGIGSNDAKGNMPGEVAGLPIVDLAPSAPLAVVAGNNVSCAHMDNMTVRCWAGLYNGLGDTMFRGDQPGEMGVNLPAIDVGGPVQQVFDVGDGGCVRLVGGAIKCWGYNQNGQLGLGDTEHRGDQPGEMGAALPALDFAGAQVVDLEGTHGHRCALFADGTVRCWGPNPWGALGQGDELTRGDEPGEMGAALPAIDLL